MKTTNKTFDVITIKSKALTLTMGALNAVASMGISLLASIIITDVISFFDDMNETSEELAKNIETTKSNIEELTSTFSNQKKTVSDVGKRYAELAQGVNQLTGENNSLSTESYNEFLEISEQLADIFPTLQRTFNNNGNAIVSLSEDVDTIVGSLDQLIEKERELINIQLTEELPDLFDDVKKQSDLYDETLTELKQKRDSLLQDNTTFSQASFINDFAKGIENGYLKISSRNAEQRAKMVADYTKILDDAQIEYNLDSREASWDGTYNDLGLPDYVYESHINVKTEMDMSEAEESLKVAINNLAIAYNDEVGTLNKEIDSINERNESNWSSLSQGLIAWVDSEDTYQIMSDEMQAVIQNMINNIDYNNLDFSSMDDLYTHIQTNMLNDAPFLVGHSTYILHNSGGCDNSHNLLIIYN